MSINNNKENRNILSILTRTFLVLVCSALIVWVLPGQTGPSRLFYRLGSPWEGNTLIAEFNFDVYRADSTIEKDKEKIRREFIPYYFLDKNVEQQAIDEFEKDFTEEHADSLYPLKDRIVRRMHSIYSQPVMSTVDSAKIFGSDTLAVIRLLEGKTVSRMRRENFLFEKKAYNMLFFDEKLAKSRQTLYTVFFKSHDYIRPNVKLDVDRNNLELKQLLNNVATGVGKKVEKGEKIIDRGEIVTDSIALKIDSMAKALNEEQNKDTKELMLHTLGQFLYVLVFLTLFTFYLLMFRKKHLHKPRNILMLYALVTIFPIIISLFVRMSVASQYILPLAMVAMLTQVFLDSRTAFITHVTMVMISALAVNDQFEFIVIQMVAGLAAIFALNDMSKRAQLFKAALMVFISSLVIWYALQLIRTGHLVPDNHRYWAFLVNAVLLLLAYPLMFLIEKAFGFTSNVTLLELSDTNKDLLRRLSEVAPGTFQHSITVGNLASEIANRIGANGLLVRTGALYHDIGKMTNPVFFTENQANVNPHDRLNEKESARIIINHVAEGQRLAEEFDLPVIIKNFILTHHGQGLAKYFYVKYKNAHPDEEVDTELFTYPGPNPSTREQAILMMADGVEAASRSLDEYNDETIRNLVNKIVDGMVSGGFFTECSITFRDITIAKQVMVERLKNIYHTRIKYPELDKDLSSENEKE